MERLAVKAMPHPARLAYSDLHQYERSRARRRWRRPHAPARGTHRPALLSGPAPSGPAAGAPAPRPRVHPTLTSGSGSAHPSRVATPPRPRPAATHVRPPDTPASIDHNGPPGRPGHLLTQAGPPGRPGPPAPPGTRTARPPA